MVPNKINEQIKAGGVTTLIVEVAALYPNGFESPFSIDIELDSCSNDDAGVDISVCGIDEENKGNYSGEVIL